MWAPLWFVASVTCTVNVIDNGVSVVTPSVPNITVVGAQNNWTIENKAADDASQYDHVVQTDHGVVTGYQDDTGIIQYFDIPYGRFSAETPFQEPLASESWESVHEKSEHASFCPQIDSEDNYIGSHDCLTLSVFKPENAENADVLFHIHDSSFNSGSGDPKKYGPKYLVSQGIILVLPNYRLGPLGFLCMQNESALGNAGLKDLTLALQWTKNNINTFGGNESNIVISGSGAAGALVEYLLLSNNSRPLISKAIIESGFVLSPWAIDRDPLETAKTFMEKLSSIELPEKDENIYYSTPNQVNLERLVRAGHGINFRPCVKDESGFLTDSPWHLLNNEKIEATIMSGSANQAAMDKALQQTDETLSQINEDYFLLLPDDLKFDNSDDKIRIARQVKMQYFGENNITINDMEKLSQCYSDSEYLYPGIREARLLSKGGANVYFYEFSYGNSHPVKGSARGDILGFVFNKEEVTHEIATETHMKDIITNLWVSYIKTGKPSADNVEWNNLEVSAESEETWLSIGDEVCMQKGFHQSRLKLWDEIYEKHFVELNLAFNLNCSIYIILFGLLSIKYFTVNFK